MYRHESSRLYIADYRRDKVPHIEVTYKRKVPTRVMRGIVDMLSRKACGKDLLSIERVDIYARRLGRLDRQDKQVMVRVYADPHDFFSTREEMDRIQHRMWSLLSEHISFNETGVEIVTTPAHLREPSSSI